MDCTIDSKGGFTFVRLSERIHAAAAGDLEKQFDLILAGNNKFIGIDMKQVDFISSSGLRVFLILAKKIKAIQGKLVLFCLSENVKEVFDLSGFSSIFTITPDEESAARFLAE